MFSKVQVTRYKFSNPAWTLNNTLPKLLTMNVILELENEDKWTHLQRRKFNFVLMELLNSITDEIRNGIDRNTNDDAGDIPF